MWNRQELTLTNVEHVCSLLPSRTKWNKTWCTIIPLNLIHLAILFQASHRNRLLHTEIDSRFCSEIEIASSQVIDYSSGIVVFSLNPSSIDFCDMWFCLHRSIDFYDLIFISDFWFLSDFPFSLWFLFHLHLIFVPCVNSFVCYLC